VWLGVNWGGIRGKKETGTIQLENEREGMGQKKPRLEEGTQCLGAKVKTGDALV